jgi:pyruvate/2-oxoglutarate dehydrogenase complex dihydrolipoamide acyltransferase (E2) component
MGKRPVLMPSVEVGMEQGRLVEFLVEVGAAVVVGDPLFTVEGEKAMLDIESPVAGRIAALTAAPGSELAVGAEVLVIEVAA